MHRPPAGTRLSRLVLPVSGAAVSLRAPTGVEELLLAEGDIADPRLTLALVEHLGVSPDVTDWETLPATDADTLILRLRQALAGDRIIAELSCAAGPCGRMVDLSFGLDAYLHHHAPRPFAWRGRPVARDGDWFVLGEADEAARFRLPTLADQIAVDGTIDPVAALAQRCMPGVPARLANRVERAMAALAPPLAGPLQAHCPHCGAAMTARFNARRYCLQELRDRARFIHDDVDVLAELYHWSERAILTLPRTRRALYAERARQAQAG